MGVGCNSRESSPNITQKKILFITSGAIIFIFLSKMSHKSHKKIFILINWFIYLGHLDFISIHCHIKRKKTAEWDLPAEDRVPWGADLPVFYLFLCSKDSAFSHERLISQSNCPPQRITLQLTLLCRLTVASQHFQWTHCWPEQVKI